MLHLLLLLLLSTSDVMCAEMLDNHEQVLNESETWSSSLHQLGVVQQSHDKWQRKKSSKNSLNDLSKTSYISNNVSNPSQHQQHQAAKQKCICLFDCIDGRSCQRLRSLKTSLLKYDSIVILKKNIRNHFIAYAIVKWISKFSFHYYI